MIAYGLIKEFKDLFLRAEAGVRYDNFGISIRDKLKEAKQRMRTIIECYDERIEMLKEYEGVDIGKQIKDTRVLIDEMKECLIK